MRRRALRRRRCTILVPLDESTLGERVLRRRRRVFWPSGADVLLLEVVGPRHAGMLVRGDDAAAYHSTRGAHERAQRYLERVRRRLAREKVRSRVLVRAGDPAGEIVKCAHAEGVALIVMSTHGRSGIRRALLGSVAESVARHARVPSLLVPARAR